MTQFRILPTGFLLCAGFGYFLPVHADDAAKDFRIISCDEKKLILEYVPEFPSFTNFSIEGKTYVSVQLNKCGNLNEEGKPMLPIRTLLVGVPPYANVTARAVDIQYTELEGYQPVPVPRVKADRKGNVVEKSYRKDTETYSRDSFFPSLSVEVSAVSWLRHQKVVNVYLFPVQYNPVSGRLRICKKMVVEIDFGYDAKSARQELLTTDPVFEKFYAGNLLNYEVAKKWRGAVPKRVTKPAKGGSTFSGSWYKMFVENDGIYKLEYTTLAGMGFDSTALNAELLRIFYGGGRELPQQITEMEPDLKEIATYFYDANKDGLLGKEDYLLFYGQGTSGWAYDLQRGEDAHYLNRYTSRNVYWLWTGSAGRKKMQQKDGGKLSYSAPAVVRKYRNRIFQEKEKLNREQSGIEWMWDRLYGSMYREYPVRISGVSEGDSAVLRARVQGITEDHHDVSFFLNGRLLQEIDLPYTLAKAVEMGSRGILVNGDNILRISLGSLSGIQSEIYFDWYELEFWRYLRAESDYVWFSSSDQQGVLEYRLEGFSTTNITVFDVSNPYNVVKIENAFVDSTNFINFRDFVISSAEHHYIAITESQYKPVSHLAPTSDPYSNLRLTTNGADYVIIAHEGLKGSSLERLAAHRREGRYWLHEGDPEVKIVTTEEIYNEFSWGLFDPTAIRNFLKYAYKNWRVAPSYVLLVGDACYDMKNNLADSPPTLVPTFEDELRATDDWFVQLDGDRTMDMLVGRLAVQNVAELEVVVDKIIYYDTAPAYGPWKNTLLLAADDDYSPDFNYDDHVFGLDTETLATNAVASSYDVKKVYLYAYPRDRFGKKPQAKEDFIRNFNQGALYINYLGHGNHEQLAHENIFYSPDDVGRLANDRRLPLLFAGTCAVGQFDYDRKKSMAEELIQRSGGGCFAVVGASRWNSHLITFGINKVFYQNVLTASNAGAKSLGQALLESKLQSRYQDHRELLVLFGDPAQRLAVPEYSVSLSLSPDSIALTKNVQLKGEIRKADSVLSDFSGSVFVRFYENIFKRYAAGYEYSVAGRVVYEDTLRVRSGKVDSHFFLRADTTAGGSLGRIAAYAWEEKSPSRISVRDAGGFLDSLHVLADTLTPGTRVDSLAPQITVSINGVSVDPQDEIAVTPSFTPLFRVSDDYSAINVSGKTGYEIIIQLDDRSDKIWNVTSDFVFDDEGKRAGHVAFRFEDIEVGTHHILFSVWDNSLNRSALQLRIVVEPPEFQILYPLNFPNPTSGRTSFTFTLSHSAEVTIKIYTIAGRLVRVFQTYAMRGFNRFPEGNWDCTDEDGDPLANGVYLYKIIAKPVIPPHQTMQGARTVETVGRLAIVK
jgi:hypothetical protein